MIEKIPVYAQVCRSLFRNQGDRQWISTAKVKEGTDLKHSSVLDSLYRASQNSYVLRKKRPAQRGGYVIFWKLNEKKLKEAKETMRKYFGEEY